MLDTLWTFLFGRRYVFWQMTTNVRAAIWIEEAEIKLNEARVLRLQKEITIKQDDIANATNKQREEYELELKALEQELQMAEGDVAAKKAQVEKTRLKLKFLKENY